MSGGGYVHLVTDGERIVRPGYLEAALEEPSLASAAAAALEYARLEHARVVLWVHELAHRRYGLPADRAQRKAALVSIGCPPVALGDPWSAAGWLRLSRDVHLSFPTWSGDFAGTASPEHLARAVAMLETLLGTSFVYSAPATALFLVDDRDLRLPSAPSGVPYEPGAFSIASTTWSRPSSREERRAMRTAHLFDRRGSYLAAWRSLELPDGEWIAEGRSGAETFARADAAGYYRVDLEPLRPYIDSIGLHDPFTRAPRTSRRADLIEPASGPTWLTAPLASLALELAGEAGIELRIPERVIGSRTVRPLDRAADRLAHAYHELEASEDPLAPVVLAVVKDAYVRATAYLEYGKVRPHPLARPEWRHTIVDRHLANTWRALRRASRRPLIVGGIDSAVFPLARGEAAPPGLRVGPELGSWRRKAAHATTASLERRIAAGDAERALRELIDRAADGG